MFRFISLIYLYLCLNFTALTSGENHVSSISSILRSINTTASVALTTSLGPQIDVECPEYYNADMCLEDTNVFFMGVIKSIESVKFPPDMQASFCSAFNNFERNCLSNQITGCPTVVNMAFDLYREFYQQLCDSYGYKSFVNSLTCFNNSLFTIQVDVCAESIPTDGLGADICWLPDNYINCVTQAANISCSEKTTDYLTEFLQGVFLPFKVFFSNSSFDLFDAITNSTNGTFHCEPLGVIPTDSLVDSKLDNASVPEVSTVEANSTIVDNTGDNTSVSDNVAVSGTTGRTGDADWSTAEITTAAASQQTDTSAGEITTAAASQQTETSAAEITTAAASQQTDTSAAEITTAAASQQTETSAAEITTTASLQKAETSTAETTTTSTSRQTDTSSTATTTTTASTSTTTLPPRPPYQCYDCSSGAPGYWQNTACPANGSLNGWARQTQRCTGPCVTTVSRWPLGDVIRGCSTNYRYQFTVPSNGCKKNNDDLVCFCSQNRCNDGNMTREQSEHLAQYGS